MGVSGKDIGALKRNSGTSPDWGQPPRERRRANETQLHHTADWRRELPGQRSGPPRRLDPVRAGGVSVMMHTPPQRPGRFSVPW
jgi:hypothetical protein